MFIHVDSGLLTQRIVHFQHHKNENNFWPVNQQFKDDFSAWTDIATWGWLFILAPSFQLKALKTAVAHVEDNINKLKVCLLPCQGYLAALHVLVQMRKIFQAFKLLIWHPITLLRFHFFTLIFLFLFWGSYSRLHMLNVIGVFLQGSKNPDEQALVDQQKRLQDYRYEIKYVD